MSGPKKSTMGKLHDKVSALLAQYGYDPLERQIKMAGHLEALLASGYFEDNAENLRLMELIVAIYRHTTPYCYPQLKAVEHTQPASEVPALSREERLAEIARLQALVRQQGGMVPDDAIQGGAEA